MLRQKRQGPSRFGRLYCTTATRLGVTLGVAVTGQDRGRSMYLSYFHPVESASCEECCALHAWDNHSELPKLERLGFLQRSILHE
jgi:hypothetical protein